MENKNTFKFFIISNILWTFAFSQNPEWINYTNGHIISAIATTGNEIWIGTKGSGLVKFDGGNWTVTNSSNSGLPGDVVNCIEVDIKGNIWFATCDGLVKFDGTVWTVYNESNSGLPVNEVGFIFVDNNDNKWICTDAGLVVFKEGGVVSIEKPPNLVLQNPTQFVLNQNYPNPFNPSTKIKFSLPKPEHVKIEVYNIIGQKIETLLNKSVPAG